MLADLTGKAARYGNRSVISRSLHIACLRLISVAILLFQYPNELLVGECLALPVSSEQPTLPGFKGRSAAQITGHLPEAS
jgi:hypothetical protein